MRRRKTPAGGGESPNLTDRGGRYPPRGGLVCQGPSQAGGCLRATPGPPLEAVQTPDPITTPHPPGGIAEIPPPTPLKSPPCVTANEESGSYPSLTAEVTPQSVLTLLCPWTKEIPTRLRQRLHWNPTPLPEGEIHDPTALILYAGDDDPTSLHQAMLQESQPRLTTNVLARQSSMTCSERNHMADFVEQPYRANSGPYWAAQLPHMVHPSMVPQTRRSSTSPRAAPGP